MRIAVTNVVIKDKIQSALKLFEKANELEPNNALIMQLLDTYAKEVMQKEKGFSKGEMPFGDLFMKGYGNED
jgi:hypothetical protein